MRLRHNSGLVAGFEVRFRPPVQSSLWRGRRRAGSGNLLARNSFEKSFLHLTGDSEKLRSSNNH